MARTKAEWNSRFKLETQKHLAELRSVLASIKVNLPKMSDAGDLTTMRELNPDLYTLFRLAHTIKGLAAMLGLNEFVDITEQMEVALGESLFNPVSFDNTVQAQLGERIVTLEAMTAQIEN